MIAVLLVQQVCSVTIPPDDVRVNHNSKDVNVIHVRSTISVSPTVNRVLATDTRTNVTLSPENVRAANIIRTASTVTCALKDFTEMLAKVGV